MYTSLRAFVPGSSSRPVSRSKNCGSATSEAKDSSSSTVWRVSIPDPLNDAETMRFARRLISGCAAKTSRTCSCTSTVSGTIV